MRIAKPATLFSVSLALTACGGEQAAKAPATTTPIETAKSASMPLQPKDGDYPAKGKVTKIDRDIGSIELDHKEIKDVMPEMRMEFYVSDRSILNGLRVGDEVDFTLRYKHPTETIVAITKSK